MLWMIAVILTVLWLLRLVSSYALGGFIHILLLIAIVVVLLRMIQGRRILKTALYRRLRITAGYSLSLAILDPGFISGHGLDSDNGGMPDSGETRYSLNVSSNDAQTIYLTNEDSTNHTLMMVVLEPIRNWHKR